MSNELVIGSATVQATYTPWPDTWTWPTYVYPTYVYPSNTGDAYANEVEIVQNEHDATIHFYRSSGPNKGRTHIKTITVPIGVLEWMQGRA